MPRIKKKMVHVYLPDWMLGKLKEAAEKRGMTVSELIRHLIFHYLTRIEEKEVYYQP